MKSKITLTDCSGCVNFNLRKAMRAVSQHYDKILAPVKLRCTQFTILTILDRVGTVTITELAEYLIMDRTTLTRNLKPLVKEGYIIITSSVRDKRSRCVALTSAGKEIRETAMPYWEQAQNEIVSFMGEENAIQFIQYLQTSSTFHHSA